MMFQTGDLVLRYTPQLKPGEANKFHRQWEAPFTVVERVTDVTYRVEKVRGQSRRCQVVHFNNLRLYQRRQEAPLKEPVAQGESEASERVAPACGEAESGESDTVTGGTEDEVIGVGARDEPSDEVVDVQEESGYESCLAEMASVGEMEPGGGRDEVVDSPDTEGGGLLGNVQTGHASAEEKREDEREAEEEPPVGRSPRPVRVKKPPDCYGEWILNTLQQISDRHKMMEDMQRENKGADTETETKIAEEG